MIVTDREKRENRRDTTIGIGAVAVLLCLAIYSKSVKPQDKPDPPKKEEIPEVIEKRFQVIERSLSEIKKTLEEKKDQSAYIIKLDSRMDKLTRLIEELVALKPDE